VSNWRPVPGYEGRYDVSDSGEVRGWMLGSGTDKRRAAPLILKPWVTRAGYATVTLRDSGGVGRQGRVARLLLLAFAGPPPDPSWHAAHLNGIRLDNRLANLQWKSPQENVDDKTLHGTQTAGETHPQAILTALQVRAIRTLRSAGWSNRAIAAVFGRSKHTVHGITSGNDRVTAPDDIS